VGGTAGVAVSLGILASLAPASSYYRWLKSRAEVLEKAARVCGVCPVVHRFGREASCRKGDKVLCIDLIYDRVKAVKVKHLKASRSVSPLAPISFSCAAEIEDGRIVFFSGVKPNYLDEGVGYVVKLDGLPDSWDYVESMLG